MSGGKNAEGLQRPVNVGKIAVHLFIGIRNNNLSLICVEYVVL